MRVESHLKHVFICESVKIFPGINFLPNIMSVIDNPMVKSRFDNGSLKLLDKAEKVEKIKDILGYDAKTLAKTIPELCDVRLLEKIRDADKRPAVVKLAEKRLAILREGEPRSNENGKEVVFK